MGNTLPLILATGRLSLFAADVNGQPILTQPIWMGARAEGLRLDADIEEVPATPSGAIHDEFAQLSEQHEIAIERIWVLPLGAEAGPGAARFVDYDFKRGRYVMQVFGLDERTGLWHERTYYNVQAKRYGLRSNGVMQFGSDQIFRAGYFTVNHGSSGSSGTLTPAAPSGFEQPLLFTHDDPLPQDEYFIGFYQFPTAVRIGFTKAIALASQASPTVLTLEIAGVLTPYTLTLPPGFAGEEVSDENTFNLDVQAHASIRWKITSAPGSGLAEYAGITMRVAAPIAESGSSADTSYVMIADAPPGPAPDDPTKIWTIHYRDGSDSQTWDPYALPPAWF